MEQEEKRLLEIVEEQKKRIAELETKLRDALGSLSEMEAKYVVKDDEAGELDAALDVANSKLADKEGVFEGFINRISTMALVHGKLQTSDSGKMSMWMLATAIADQYGFAEKGVRVNVNIPMDMALPAKIAVPCMWIINELVSNAFKYAFPGGRKGEVKVEMKIKKGKMLLGFSPDWKLTEGDEVELTVSDNGVGIPICFDLFTSESLGMRIVNLFAEQLCGETEVDDNNGYGTKFTIKFEI